MTHPDIRLLQITLNADPDTKLAESGPGSPGSETTFFGLRTWNAVCSFQEKYSTDVLVYWNLEECTGFVGTSTRAKLNQLLSDDVRMDINPCQSKLDLSMVRMGDILLGRAPDAKWSKYWPSYYTHAALVLDRNTTLEIRGPGQTVEVYPISEWCEDFGRYYSRVTVLRVDTSDSARQAAINKGKELYGTTFVDPGNPIDWHFATLAKFPNPVTLYCSALVFHGYKWGASIDIDADGGVVVWPDDIAVDDDVQYISVQNS